MKKVFIFKYCNSKEFKKETLTLTIPAFSMREAVGKFRSMIPGDVFIKEIKEELHGFFS
jgi:hypothetical protein